MSSVSAIEETQHSLTSGVLQDVGGHQMVVRPVIFFAN